MSQKQIIFTVEGMNCGGCVSKIKDQMKSNHNGLEVDVSLEQKSVVIPTNTTEAPLGLKKTIEAAGFQVTKMETR